MGRLACVRKRDRDTRALQGFEGMFWDSSVPVPETPLPPSKPLCLTSFGPPPPPLQALSVPHPLPSRLGPESHKGGNLMENAQLGLGENIPCW